MCEEHDSALVPTMYVDDDGYPLGEQLHNFRQGKMRKGLPEEAQINAWAEALPGWHWDARKSERLRTRCVCSGLRSRAGRRLTSSRTPMAKYVDQV